MTPAAENPLTSTGLARLGAVLPPRLAALEAQAKAALSLTELVRATLPAEQRNHLLSAVYRNDTLSVTMDSAAWCPQVRLSEASLRERLKAAGGPDFVKLRVRVGRAG